MKLRILTGDWIEQLRTLPDQSVHCCVTSPPYWGLRDYGVPGQLGLEKTPEEYIAKIVAGFGDVRRVLRDDGTLWVNLGDSYASDSKGSGGPSEKQLSNAGSRYKTSQRLNHGLKAKDLVGIPWRVAFALQTDGWYLRSDIIWHKPNPMPESVTDRPTKSHEYIFLLSKQERYYYDGDAVREPYSLDSISRYKSPMMGTAPNGRQPGQSIDRRLEEKGIRDPNPLGRNKRTVWSVTTSPYKEAHFATFPPDLIKPCIMAGTSARGCCPHCGAPWERIVEKSGGTIGHSWHDHKDDLVQGQRSDAPSLGKADYGNGEYQVKTVGWQPTCDCGYGNLIPCTVLDPFAGSFTTCAVAIELGRKAIGIELNPKYVEMGKARCNITPGLALA